MAAILCQGIGKLCSGLCKGCETVCCAPFKALKNPFSITVITAIAFSAPPIVSSLGSLSEFSPTDGCKSSTWLLGNTVFCAVNIAGAVYIFILFASTDTGSPSLIDDGTMARRFLKLKGFDRAMHILCQDPGVAVYILALVGFFVWLCLGASWWSNGSMPNGCMNSYDNAVSTSLGCGFSYLTVGFISLCCAMCCSCCCYNSRNDETIYRVPNANGSYGANDIESIPVAVATPVDTSGSSKKKKRKEKKWDLAVS